MAEECFDWGNGGNPGPDMAAIKWPVPKPQGVAELLRTFTDKVAGLPAPTGIAWSDGWFNDVYWERAVELACAGQIFSTRDSYADDPGQDIRQRADNHRYLTVIEDLLKETNLDGELSRRAIECAIGATDGENVVAFVKLPSPDGERIFLATFSSNGDEDVAFELHGGRLFFWDQAGFMDSLGNGQWTFALPSRDEAAAVHELEEHRPSIW